MSEVEREQHWTNGKSHPSGPPLAATPIFMAISGSLPGGKWLINPIVVKIEEDDGEILVAEDKFHIHAVGSTVQEAIAGFKRILSEELDELTSDEEELGPRLQAELQYLRDNIRAA